MRTIFKTTLFVLLAAILISDCSQKSAPTITSIPSAGVSAHEVDSQILPQ